MGWEGWGLVITLTWNGKGGVTFYVCHWPVIFRVIDLGPALEPRHNFIYVPRNGEVCPEQNMRFDCYES